jgi:hypothetical protein
MLCLSSYYLCFLFNKIRDKGRIVSAWKRGGLGGEEKSGEVKKRVGVGGRNDPNIVCTYE